MTRVDLLLDPESNKTSVFQCLLPDELAQPGKEIRIKLGEEERVAKVYNVLPPLMEFEITHP